MPKKRQALQMLQHQTVDFLRVYALKIERAVGVSGQCNYTFGAIDAQGGDYRYEYERTPRVRLVRGEWIEQQSKNFSLRPAVGGTHFHFGSIPVQVWHVDVVHANAIDDWGNLQWMAASRHNGPDLVATTTLTGCSFAFRPGPNAVEFVHIRPVGLQPHEVPIQLANANPGVQSFCPRDDYDQNVEEITIVGVRDGRDWCLYAQHRGNGFNLYDIRAVDPFFRG